MLAEEQAKVSPARGRSALRSGALTGLSYVALSLAAALAGAFLAHKFGRNLQTDGFMAAYGVYLVLVLGAQAFRMVVVPDLTRAEEDGRLGAEPSWLRTTSSVALSSRARPAMRSCGWP